MASRIARGLHGQVLNVVGERIVDGTWAPGTVIEVDALEAEFEVSRTTVREVLKSLTDKGLVDARPRLGTYVLDHAHWNYLDPDVMAWRAREPLDASFVRSLNEVRAVLEPGAARLAAAARSEQDVVTLREAFAELERSAEGDPAHIAEVDVRLHRAILAATHNELLFQFEVVLEPALRSRNRAALWHVHDLTFVSLHRAVVEAIVAGDGARAEQAMSALLTEAAEDIGQVLDPLS
ncbi:hypothetical protein BHE97_04520 [Aeromicrobium sp. PE09-221]|uniref:FadR/GntR family transcriptional regulator n=1 Tax=Aeromicrobium sp. PE09-221 TaxID=1898043 RepID=UPI000B3EB8E9|nr:FadR/GntR family transcriptional regulator [Aeromicrobium sp. PE09-221]OUZ11603.1 hypothetical protein BHE97_04520 [Aeromicrobium sp. PE09-221]